MGFQLWFERHLLEVNYIPLGWLDDFRRTAWCAYLEGRRVERAKATKEIDALKAEIKQNYIDEIIGECSGGGEGLLDSAWSNYRTVGLRKLAEWGIVTIEEDLGRRVIARLVEAEKNGG